METISNNRVNPSNQQYETTLLLKYLFDSNFILVEINEETLKKEAEIEYQEKYKKNFNTYLLYENLFRQKIIDTYSKNNFKNLIYVESNKAIFSNTNKKLSVVKDNFYPNKYLIMLSLHQSYADEYIYGMSVNFDDKGNTVYQSEKIYPSYLFRCGYDISYCVKNKQVKLYRDKLVLLWQHRDRQDLTITLVSLEPFAKTENIWNLNIFGQILDNNDIKNIILENQNNPKYIIINLESMKINDKEINIEIKRTDNYEKEDKVEEYDKYSSYNGYPTTCTKCKKKTCLGGYNFNQNIYSGFGYGFCPDCMIRYSLSESAWICCKPVKSENGDYTIYCGKKLSEYNNFICNEKHYINKFSITRNKTFIPPYLDECHLTYYNTIQDNDILE